MNKRRLCGLSLALAAVTALSGCAAPRYAETPVPARFAASQQQKLQAAAHWQAIAENLAAQISQDLKNKGQARLLHVKLNHTDTPFVEDFRELLTTALVNQGWDLSTSPTGAMTVDVRYSIQRFRPDRAKNVYYYGDASMLVAGLWAIVGIADSGLTRGAKLLTMAGSVEGFNWLRDDYVEGLQRGQVADGTTPRSEIMLTAQVLDGDRIVARRTNLYYTADEDFGLYRQQAAANLSVKGGE